MSDVEFPVVPSEWSARRQDDSDVVTFACSETFDGILPPPLPVQAHIDERRVNFNYNSSLDTDTRHVLKAVMECDEFSVLNSGWIVSIPEAFDVNVPERSKDTLYFTNRGEETGWVTTDNLSNQLFSTNNDQFDGFMLIDTLWVPDIEDGYSMLVVHPPFLNDDDFRVMPSMIDADSVPQFLKVVIGFKSGVTNVSFSFGDALAQVIPVHRQTATNIHDVIS